MRNAVEENFTDAGRLLHLSRDPGDRDVRDLRESFAEHARAAGLTAEATWREDRAEVREGVAEGREVLRPHRDHGRRALAQRAPDWSLAYEATAATRRVEARQRRRAGEPPWPSEPPRPQGLARVLPRRRRRKRPGPEQARLEARLAPLYADAGAAVETWRQLRSELGERGDKPSHADWLVANRPESFGDPLAPAFRANGRSALAGDKDIRRLLRGAAAEMPREMPPRPEGQLAAERRRRDLGVVAKSLRGVAGAVDDPALAEAVRDEAGRAAAWAEEKAGPVRRPARPAPAPVSRPAPAPGAEAPPLEAREERNAGTPSQLPIVGPKALRIPGKRNEKPCDDSSRFASASSPL